MENRLVLGVKWTEVRAFQRIVMASIVMAIVAISAIRGASSRADLQFAFIAPSLQSPRGQGVRSGQEKVDVAVGAEDIALLQGNSQVE